MGQEILKALCREPSTQAVGAVDLEAKEENLPLPDDSGTVPFSASLEDILTSCRPDVMVDFTIAQATRSQAGIAAKQGVNLVIGTSGLTADDLSNLEQLAQTHNIGIVFAANFALGAVLMMHLAKITGKYLDYAEIIELHHHLKADAPSGTAWATARAMTQARGKPFNRPTPPEKTPSSRGEDIEGIAIHSTRLPGLMAHQEVIFGAPGQTLSIRHDTINRECYIPGIMLAIKEVVKRPGFTNGLEALLNL